MTTLVLSAVLVLTLLGLMVVIGWLSTR